MKILTYKDGKVENIWLYRRLAEDHGRTEIFEVPDDHPDVLAYNAAVMSARSAEAAERTDKSTLRDQIIGATEVQWLKMTEVQRQKIILKALKYMARNL